MLFTLCNNNKHSNLNLIDRHQFPWLTVSIMISKIMFFGSCCGTVDRVAASITRGPGSNPVTGNLFTIIAEVKEIENWPVEKFCFLKSLTTGFELELFEGDCSISFASVRFGAFLICKLLPFKDHVTLKLVFSNRENTFSYLRSEATGSPDRQQ